MVHLRWFTSSLKGMNTEEFKVSSVQKLIDDIDGKYYYKFWTPNSMKEAMDVCGFTEPGEINFPPRGEGMSGIEYLEYYFSRDPELLPEENLKFPWPLAIILHIQTSLRQCNWIWRRFKNGERIVRYSKCVTYISFNWPLNIPFLNPWILKVVSHPFLLISFPLLSIFVTYLTIIIEFGFRTIWRIIKTAEVDNGKFQ